MEYYGAIKMIFLKNFSQHEKKIEDTTPDKKL